MLRNSSTAGLGAEDSPVFQEEKSPFYDHDGRKSEFFVRCLPSRLCPSIRPLKYSRLRKNCMTSATIWWKFGLSKSARVAIGVASICGALFVMRSTRSVFAGMNAEIDKLELKLEEANTEAAEYKSLLSSERDRFSHERETLGETSALQSKELEDMTARVTSLNQELNKLNEEHRASVGKERQKAEELTNKLKDASKEYEIRIHDNTQKRIQLQREVKELQIRLAELDSDRVLSNGEMHASERLQNCQDDLSQLENSLEKVNDQLSEIRELRGEPGLELMGVFSLLCKGEDVLGELMVTGALATQRDSGIPAKINVKRVGTARSEMTGSFKADYWHSAVEACMSVGRQTDKFVVFMEPDTFVMDGWLRQILTCFHSNSGGLTNVCCMPLGNGEKYCDTGLFAVKCNSHVLSTMAAIKLHLQSLPKYDYDRNSYAALNWGLLQLGWTQVKFLPGWEFRNQLGNDEVTTYDLRTLGKAYRASGPLGTEEKTETKQDRLIKMRANVWEEKAQMNELDVRMSLYVGWLPPTQSCVYSLVDPLRKLPFPEISQSHAKGEKWKEVEECQGLVPVPGPPSYSQALVKQLDVWVSQRYYSDRIPPNHPIQIPDMWKKAMPIREATNNFGNKESHSKTHKDVVSSLGTTPHENEPIEAKQGSDKLLLSPVDQSRSGLKIDPWVSFGLLNPLDASN